MPNNIIPQTEAFESVRKKRQ